MAMVLTVFLAMGSTAQAAGTNCSLIIKYKVGDSTEEATPVFLASKVQYIQAREPDVYYAQLPYGAEITELAVNHTADMLNFSVLDKTQNCLNMEADLSGYTELVYKDGRFIRNHYDYTPDYLIGDDFITFSSTGSGYSNNFAALESYKEALELISGDWKGFAVEVDDNGIQYWCIIQIANSPAAEDQLVDQIAKLPTEITSENRAEVAEAVKAAREAYNALGAEKQAKVTNYTTLKLAEKTLELLEAKEELEEAKSSDTATKSEIEKLKKDLEAAKADAAAAKTQLEEVNAQNATVKGLKVTSKAKKLTITWKKTANAKGYQVAYKLKTNKSFKNTKVSSTKKVVKNLKKGKKYQVKVRPYTTVSDKTVYGKWTAVKTIKCK